MKGLWKIIVMLVCAVGLTLLTSCDSLVVVEPYPAYDYYYTPAPRYVHPPHHRFPPAHPPRPPRPPQHRR